MAIRAVLFDLDDTLLWDDRSVKEAFEATCRIAADEKGVDPAELEGAVRREARALYESYETFPFTKRIGINPFEGLWARFSEGEQQEFRQLERLAPGYRTESWTKGLLAVGVDDPELGYRLGETFPKERRARPLVYEETFAVLTELKESYKLLLLTNGSPDLQKEKLSGVPELSGYFDHIVISGAFGEGKPAASIFRHATELLGIRPEEGIMVGDKLTTDIIGANGVGMTSVWINRHGVSRTDDIIPSYEIDHLRKIRTILDELN
ncbi:HAD family hydrolase [Paenibacillus flagellatus]|uniref:Phosphoserine phosphatase n=1 Tax=Paenibacillus flagellatus TaxID=2211139 RepID=A0A2V5KV26_9BACL|nr:HAD family hydrolase [Paenibacillus flagellatus]PYI55907.1 haloacid dehalogenase [Paenibacillus flagellatus]